MIWTKETKIIAKQYHTGADKKYKENSDCYVECDGNCMRGEKCKNKRIQNEMWKSVEKRETENGKGYGIFVKENCKEGVIIEYVGQVVQKSREIVLYT